MKHAGVLIGMSSLQFVILRGASQPLGEIISATKLGDEVCHLDSQWGIEFAVCYPVIFIHGGMELIGWSILIEIATMKCNIARCSGCAVFIGDSLYT